MDAIFVVGRTRPSRLFFCVCDLCVVFDGSGLVVVVVFVGLFLFPFVCLEGRMERTMEWNGMECPMGPGRWMDALTTDGRTDDITGRSVLVYTHTEKKDAHRSIHPDARDRHLQRVRTKEGTKYHARGLIEIRFFVCADRA